MERGRVCVEWGMSYVEWWRSHVVWGRSRGGRLRGKHKSCKTCYWNIKVYCVSEFINPEVCYFFHPILQISNKLFMFTERPLKLFILTKTNIINNPPLCSL